MSANDAAAAAWEDYINQQQEAEIEKLKKQIKRLIEAGDRMDLYAAPHDSDRWNEAKEALKP